MVSYKTGIILLVNYPCLVRKHLLWYLHTHGIEYGFLAFMLDFTLMAAQCGEMLP